MKREDYITWDEFFIGVAELASKRSKDPNTRHGCCIIEPSTNNVLSIGYNGLPRGLSDDGCSIFNTTAVIPQDAVLTTSLVYDYWAKPQKYEYVVHAEENAIFNATTSLKGCILYLYSEKGYYPCSRCARGIIQNGIIEVVLHHIVEENTKKYNWSYTKHMFQYAGVKVRVFKK